MRRHFSIFIAICVSTAGFASAASPRGAGRASAQRAAIVAHDFFHMGRIQVRQGSSGEHVVRHAAANGWLGIREAAGRQAKPEDLFRATFGPGALAYKATAGGLEVFWRGADTRIKVGVMKGAGESQYLEVDGASRRLRDQVLGENLLQSLSKQAVSSADARYGLAYEVQEPRGDRVTRTSFGTMEASPRYPMDRPARPRSHWLGRENLVSKASRGALDPLLAAALDRDWRLNFDEPLTLKWTSDKDRYGRALPEGQRMEHSLVFDKSSTNHEARTVNVADAWMDAVDWQGWRNGLRANSNRRHLNVARTIFAMGPETSASGSNNGIAGVPTNFKTWRYSPVELLAEIYGGGRLKFSRSDAAEKSRVEWVPLNPASKPYLLGVYAGKGKSGRFIPDVGIREGFNRYIGRTLLQNLDRLTEKPKPTKDWIKWLDSETRPQDKDGYATRVYRYFQRLPYGAIQGAGGRRPLDDARRDLPTQIQEIFAQQKVNPAELGGAYQSVAYRWTEPAPSGVGRQICELTFGDSTATFKTKPLP